MTDHSLRGYLERRTTEEPDSVLAYCLREENCENYEYAILEILHVLHERFVPEVPSELPSLVAEILSRYPQDDEYSSSSCPTARHD